MNVHATSPRLTNTICYLLYVANLRYIYLPLTSYYISDHAMFLVHPEFNVTGARLTICYLLCVAYLTYINYLPLH